VLLRFLLVACPKGHLDADFFLIHNVARSPLKEHTVRWFRIKNRKPSKPKDRHLSDRQRLYRDFLQSDFWKDLSRLARILHPCCARCGATDHLHAHHKNYPDDWFKTELSDLDVLCRSCHADVHKRSKVKFTPNSEEQRQLFRLNRIKRLSHRKKLSAHKVTSFQQLSKKERKMFAKYYPIAMRNTDTYG
jgi:hypothetical protein